MTPKEYKEMMAYLTRSGVKKQVKFASDIARPDPKPVVKEIELFNAFNRRNPKADGGMLVQPGFGGTRQGYAKPVGSRKGQFTTKAMDNISDAILKAYADDDIQILFEKGKNNPQGLLTPKDSKAGIFQKIKTDQDRLNTVVKNTGLDQETILNILDDRDAFLELEKTTMSQKTRFKDRDKFFKKAEKWLTTNAKRYSDPVKFEKSFARTFGKNNLITKTIKANITDPRGKGRIQGFSDDFIKTIMATSQGIDPTRTSVSFNSIQLKDMFKTVIYNNNPNVRKRITAIFENIIPEPGSRRTPDIRNLFANDPVLKKFGLNKSIKGPIARLIANEINEDLLTNVKNFQRPFLGTDALLSFLKDRVDPKYKEMFREASNAVKQAQKNQWPEAKKTLNLSQSIMFDHKIPKSIIDLGYADEIEYIKLNPTSEKFNATIKRSQFDQPMLDLISKFENSKSLDAKAAVVKEMNTLKNNFSKKYGGYLDEITITPDETGKPIFKSSAAPVTKKTSFIPALAKSMIQAKEGTPKQIAANLRKLGFKCKFAASSGGLGRCDDPMSYVDDIKKQEDLFKVQTSKAPQAVKTLNTARKLNAARSLFTSTLGPGALAFEAVAALPIAYMGYKGGKSPENIIADSTFNLIGKSDKRVFLDKAVEMGFDTANIKRAQDFFKKTEAFQKQDARADEFMGPDDMFMYPQMVQKAERDLLDVTKQFIDQETGEVIPERVAAFDQIPLVELGVAKDQADLATKRQEQVGGFLQSPVADYLPNFAGGGIAGLSGGKKSGPPPISGPTPDGDEGLPAAFKNVRKR